MRNDFQCINTSVLAALAQFLVSSGTIAVSAKSSSREMLYSICGLT